MAGGRRRGGFCGYVGGRAAFGLGSARGVRCTCGTGRVVCNCGGNHGQGGQGGAQGGRTVAAGGHHSAGARGQGIRRIAGQGRVVRRRRRGVDLLGPIINERRRDVGGPIRRPGDRPTPRTRGLAGRGALAGVRRLRGAGGGTRGQGIRRIAGQGRVVRRRRRGVDLLGPIINERHRDGGGPIRRPGDRPTPRTRGLAGRGALAGVRRLRGAGGGTRGQGIRRIAGQGRVVRRRRRGVDLLGPIINERRRDVGGPIRRPGDRPTPRTRGLAGRGALAGVRRLRGAGGGTRGQGIRRIAGQGRVVRRRRRGVDLLGPIINERRRDGGGPIRRPGDRPTPRTRGLAGRGALAGVRRLRGAGGGTRGQGIRRIAGQGRVVRRRRRGVDLLGPIINDRRRDGGGPIPRPGNRPTPRTRGLAGRGALAGVCRRRGTGGGIRGQGNRQAARQSRAVSLLGPIVSGLRRGVAGPAHRQATGTVGNGGAVGVQINGGPAGQGALAVVVGGRGRGRGARGGVAINIGNVVIQIPQIVVQAGFLIEPPTRHGQPIEIPGLEPHTCEAVGRLFDNFYSEIVTAFGMIAPYTLTSDNDFICDPRALRQFVELFNQKTRAAKAGTIPLVIPATLQELFDVDQLSAANVIKVLDFAYKMAVPNPQKLNKGRAGKLDRSETYGEISFAQTDSILRQLGVTSRDVLLDMGSGIGNLVTYAVLASPIQKANGIELVDHRADAAEVKKTWLSSILKHFGKEDPDFGLFKGSFLEKKYKKLISTATVIFLNNFAFEPDLMTKVNKVLLAVKNGTVIVTSKRLQLGTRRTPGIPRPDTPKNRKDFETIVTTYDLDMVQGSVSWAGNENKLCMFYKNIVQR